MSKEQYQLAYADFLTFGMTKTDLARQYGVSPRTISRWIEKAKAESTSTQTQQPKQSFTDSALTKLTGEDYLPEQEVEDDEEVVEVEEDVEYRVIATRKSISLTKLVNESVVDSVVVDSGNPLFQQIFDSIKSSGLSQESLAQAYHLAKPAEAVKSFTEGQIEVDVKANKIYWNYSPTNKMEVGGSIVTRVMEGVAKSGKDAVKPLLNFLAKLMQNPSYRATKELFGFIEHSCIEITEDGDFIGYKKVREDYMDIHSNTMRNAPGDVLSVPRNMVDEDSDRTCSYGLHFAAKHYMKFYGSNSSSDRIVKVRVNPKDVAAIPKDYNNSKARCSGYTVLEDVTDQFDN